MMINHLSAKRDARHVTHTILIHLSIIHPFHSHLKANPSKIIKNPALVNVNSNINGSGAFVFIFRCRNASIMKSFIVRPTSYQTR